LKRFRVQGRKTTLNGEPRTLNQVASGAAKSGLIHKRPERFHLKHGIIDLMKLSEIIKALDGKLLTGDGFLEKNITTCGASDLMSDILAGLSEGCILLTGLTTVQVIRTAMVANVGAVVFVRGKTPPAEVVELAEENQLPLVSSPYSMFVSCGRLHDCGLTGLDGKR
jgi:predicted transcriptional regulator